MSREFSPFDVVIGFGFGVAMTFIALRMAGIVEQNVSVWGQYLLAPTVILVIARQMNQLPFQKNQDIQDDEKANG